MKMSVLFHISIYTAENLNISISFLSVSGSLVYCALSKFHFGFQQLLSENLPVVFILIEDAVDSYSSLFLVFRFFFMLHCLTFFLVLSGLVTKFLASFYLSTCSLNAAVKWSVSRGHCSSLRFPTGKQNTAQYNRLFAKINQFIQLFMVKSLLI